MVVRAQCTGLQQSQCDKDSKPPFCIKSDVAMEISNTNSQIVAEKVMSAGFPFGKFRKDPLKHL